MKLRELLSLISEIAKQKEVSTPFICGGVPRDKILNRLDHISDIDITTGDQSVHILAKEVSLALGNVNYKVAEDGHASIYIDNLKLDFSSNFRVPNIDSILKHVGVNPTDMLCELYSRDFTCNALLFTIDLKTIKDPTGLGIEDIKKKIIKTCLPPALTLGSQNRRVPRIFYLAAKLGFDVDSEIIDWVRQNPQSISNCKPKYLIEKIHKALEFDQEKTIHLLDTMNVWHYLPVIPNLVPYMNSPKRM